MSQQEEEGFSGAAISWPILLAVIPTLGTFLFGSAEIWTDFIMLLLILYYVYKWITVPWSYYESACRRRQQHQASTSSSSPQKPWIEAELKRHQQIALIWIIASPFLAGYTLQFSRHFLSNYDKYMSNFNVTVFMIAATIRPLIHITQLLKERTLYLNSLLSDNPQHIDIIHAKLQVLQEEIERLRRSTRRDLAQAVSPPLQQMSQSLKQVQKQQIQLRDWSEQRFLDLDDQLKECSKRGLVESMVFLPVHLSMSIAAKMMGGNSGLDRDRNHLLTSDK
ncbi:MAG: hypothetical protein EXX96DRAFT_583750 [Benjaminiella poitrasii]|nr:MAG: hypothetical protein EXX96DRAFT_583750 [Benjaminiella poitrasii]